MGTMEQGNMRKRLSMSVVHMGSENWMHRNPTVIAYVSMHMCGSVRLHFCQSHWLPVAQQPPTHVTKSVVLLRSMTAAYTMSHHVTLAMNGIPEITSRVRRALEYDQN